jgi:hypothetical protein
MNASCRRRAPSAHDRQARELRPNMCADPRGQLDEDPAAKTEAVGKFS